MIPYGMGLSCSTGPAVEKLLSNRFGQSCACALNASGFFPRHFPHQKEIKDGKTTTCFQETYKIQEEDILQARKMARKEANLSRIGCANANPVSIHKVVK